MLTDRYGVNDKGHLTLGGVDTVELADKFGTPLYVFDEDDIRANCRGYVESFKKHYKGDFQVLYASKAFSCKEMYRIVKDEGLGADVVSAGELYTAVSAGFDVENIYFHGNNKTPDELSFALQSGIGRIVVDNITELYTLERIAGEKGKKADILFRIKPGIDAHTHSYIQTGQIDSKFGFALENGEADEAVKTAAGLSNVNLVGIHCHIGSQIFETEPFAAAAEVMLGFAKKIRDNYGISLSEINFGGGYGIKYLKTDRTVPTEDSIKLLCDSVEKYCKELEMPLPKILVEPGRSIVGASTLTLYKVGSVKTIKDVRTYVSVDGGMADNPRYALYNADYEIAVANKADKPRDMKVTVAGKCCESGDVIQENTMIQTPEAGDTIAVLATGAYNYSMASNYNRICRPAAVMLKDKEARVVIKRETFEDLIRNDI